MTELIFAMAVALVWQTTLRVLLLVFARCEPKPVLLCADCFHAHVQYTANARRAISCTYGGAVRPMTLDVLYCTDYRDHNLPPRSVAIGFVREIAPAE